MSIPEILSPAGNLDILKAAVNAGCDAVYMGGKKFGARAYADNADDTELVRAIDYIHAHGKKIYITVNTLCKQQETEELLNYLAFLYENGADAVIVQDMGVMKLCGDYFSGMAVHASTQMTVTTPEACELLPSAVTRIVPARELSMGEIERLKRLSGREVEIFVHGALCFSYSGQCLFSSMAGGRSGNRGRCAQPCRKMYFEDSLKSGKYLFSMKDLCGLDSIPALVKAGVDSFKIEGRMKNAVYTAGVTDIYRRALDLYLSAPDKFKGREEIHSDFGSSFLKMLLETYNRGGFTGGYFDMKNGHEMISAERQNHNGLKIGEVTAVKGKKAEIQFSEKVGAGDVLEIRDGNRSVFEFTIGAANNGEKNISLYCGREIPSRGNDVYRTKNASLGEYVTQKFIENSKKLPVEAVLKMKENEPAVLELCLSEKLSGTGERVNVCATGDTVQTAKNAPLTVERISEQLKKDSDSTFFISKAVVKLEGNVFLPVSRINELRRNALSALEAQIIKSHKRALPARLTELPEEEKPECSPSIKPEHCPSVKPECSPSISVLAENRDFVSAAVSIPEVDEIIINVGRNVKEAEEAVKQIHAAGKKAVAALPYICRTATLAYLEKNYSKEFFNTADGILCRTLEELYLLTEKCGTDAGKIRLDYTLHSINSSARAFYKGIGIKRFTYSLELTENEMLKLAEASGDNVELVVYGRAPLMITAQCFTKNLYGCAVNTENAGQYLYLEDELSHEFAVKNDCDFCINVVRNSACHALTDQKDFIAAAKPSSVRFEFTDERPSDLEKIIHSYTESKRIKEIFPERHYTTGAFRRTTE